jgi:hypothetical protein
VEKQPEQSSIIFNELIQLKTAFLIADAGRELFLR